MVLSTLALLFVMVFVLVYFSTKKYYDPKSGEKNATFWGQKGYINTKDQFLTLDKPGVEIKAEYMSIFNTQPILRLGFEIMLTKGQLISNYILNYP